MPDYPSPGVNCRGDHNAQFRRDPYVTHKTHPDVRGLDGGFDNTTIFNLGAEWELPFADLIASASYLDQEWQYDEEAPPHVAFLKGLVEGANCFGALGDGICNVPGRYSSQIVYNLVHRWTERYAYEGASGFQQRRPAPVDRRRLLQRRRREARRPLAVPVFGAVRIGSAAGTLFHSVAVPS